jgi:hypothetical protein
MKRVLLVMVIFMGSLLGCGSQSHTASKTPTPTNSPAPTATNTPIPLDPALASACSISSDEEKNWSQLDSLAISASWWGISYPYNKIPIGTDIHKPYQVSGQNNGSLSSNQINPYGPTQAGLLIYICNPKNSKLSLTNILQVTLANVVPDTTNYDVEGGCYNYLQMPDKFAGTGEGCGGDIPKDYMSDVNFSATDPIGTTKYVQNVAEANSPLSNLPITSIAIRIQIPQSGKVSFIVNLKDSNGQTVQAPQTFTTLLLPTTQLRLWTGQACLNNPSLMNQIPNPPAGKTTFYVCSPQ